MTRCPYCDEDGKRSRLEAQGLDRLPAAAITYAESGEVREEDPDTRRSRYRCSRGHLFVVATLHGEIVEQSRIAW